MHPLSLGGLHILPFQNAMEANNGLSADPHVRVAAYSKPHSSFRRQVDAHWLLLRRGDQG
jgi:hypothetical protein